MTLLRLLFGRRPINAGLNMPDRIYLQAADVHLARGQKALDCGDHEKALLEFKYAVIASNEAGRSNPTALAHLKGPVLGPLNIRRTTKAQSLLDEGTNAQGRGDHRLAVKLLTEAIDLCPVAAVPSFTLRGKSYLALGKHREAIEDLSIGLAYCPSMAEGYTQRALAYDAIGDKAAASRDRDMALHKKAR